MRLRFFFIVAMLLSSFLQAQNCELRYKSRVFNSIQIYREVVYSKSAPKLIASSLGVETSINKNLVLDVFMPPPTDTVLNRPVIILGHGGGFIDAAFMGGTLLVGTKDNDDVQALADTLAHWGYVVAVIEYRTGFDPASTTSIKRAVWRGTQDMSAALRFMRKNAAWFRIDPSRLFIGGSSAGAFCGLHATFFDWNERIPESLQIGVLGGMPDLGTLHSRPVVQLTSFNPFAGNNVVGNDVDSLPKALASFWGAIADINLLQGNNKAPTIMFHGGSDPIVSPSCAQPFANVVLTAPITCGSIEIDTAMQTLGILHETYIEPGEFHEYWGAVNGMWGINGPSVFWKPIIEKTAHFFYERMRPASPVLNGPSNCLANTTQTYSVQNPRPNVSYCWEVSGGQIISPIQNGPSINVSFPASVTTANVRVQEVDAAKVASLKREKTVTVSLPSGLKNEYANNLDFTILSNPVSQELSLSIQNNLDNYHLEIFDLLGRKTQEFKGQAAFYQSDISAWPTGTYIIRITFNNKTVLTKRFVKI